MHDFWTDLRVATRRLRHAPGFALIAILSLTMAIAANLVVFGVMNAAILRPLNVAHADRLFMIEHKEKGYISQSYPDLLDFQKRNSTFTAIAGYRIGQSAVSAQGSAQQVWNYEVTSNYFDMLGVQPELGRFFHTSEEHGPNSMPYLVLSDAYWRAHFNADPNIIGTKVDVNKQPFTVIGVAPPAFHGTELFLWPSFFVPIVNEQQLEGYDFLNKRYNHGTFVIGLLKPGVTEQQALSDLNGVAAQLAKLYPETNDKMGVRLGTPGLFGDILGNAARAFLTGVMLLALLVLAAACVNLASIFAARAADRNRELVIRLAIGSSRWRVLRQVVAEAAVLSVAGGLIGNGGGSSTPVYREGTTDFRNSNSALVAKYFTISPGLLKAAGTRLLAGRDFTWNDGPHAPPVAIVNQTFAHQLFGNAPAVGKHFAEPGRHPVTYTVVGVVENGKYDSLTENPQPAMYWALGQNNENDTTLVVRSSRSPADIASALNAMMQKIDPTLPLTIQSWPEALALPLFPARVATVALGILGLLAAMLAATGIFGMASYTVARRLREMGIRVALGAQRAQVLRAALGRTVLLLGVGSVSGLLLGIIGSRVLASIVYEATVYDPIVLSGAVAAMVAIGALAALVPARRAIGVEPAVLLREE